MKLSMVKILTVLLLSTCFFLPALTVYAVQPITGQTPSGISFSELESRIDALMNEHAGASTPGTAIVVVHEGEIIFSRGYGWADIEKQVPVDPAATVFEYGSINKTFIWVAVMQLAEQGLLDLDADVRAYLPDTFIFEKPFTMRDLLNHSAGFADFLLGLFVNERIIEQFGSLEEILLDLQPPQIFMPGTMSAYSNWGTALAAFIVEHISGQDYAAFERENILFPANMLNTLNQPDWLGNDGFLTHKSKGYKTNGSGGFQEDLWSYIPLYPSGAMNGTAEDLAAFIIALTPPAGESGPLFANTDTLETLFTPSSPDPVNYPGTHHGFVMYSGVLPAFGHSGGTIAFRADFALVPETRFGFVLLTNSGQMNLIPSIRELLLGVPQTPAPVAGSNLPGAEAIEGRYISARRYHGNFLEFLSYTGLASAQMINIRALDENNIQLSAGGLGTAVYLQTEPYVFHIYDSSDNLLFASLLPQLRFRVEDGVPRIQIGDGGDFTYLPEGRTMAFLIVSLVIAALNAVFFFITPIVLLILFLIRRKKQSVRTRFDYFSIGFLLSGTLLVFNNLLLFMLFGINPYRTAAEVAPFIWINYVLAGLTALLLAGSIWSWRTAGEAGGKRKALFVITAVFTMLFIALLHNWNFFVLL
ncbi:MAG: beta-lactamase family protein [Defluviitaleaceae bacterium]|nr:beta-lactamase family protein [Defluviitaleaceae bacterium]MCL2836712.1 beta-lactamase family protein [Defluviitaleaceae bacterium]